MDFLTQLVELLQKGGPWTVAAVCMCVTVYFYREMRAERVANAKEKQELNNRLIDMTTKQIEVLTINNENQKQLVAAVRQLEG